MKKVPLYLVPSPIGDFMSDMAIQSVRLFEQTKVVFCESNAEFVTWFRDKGVFKEHHELVFMDEDEEVAIEALKKHIAAKNPMIMTADSGIPCFVDPGFEIVGWVLDNAMDAVEMVPIGMSSALDAALALTGHRLQKFVFAGHYPENYRFEQEVYDLKLPVIYYLRGQALNDFLDHIDGMFEDAPWRVLLVKDVRKRGEYAIYQVREGERPTLPKPDIGHDYVAVITMRVPQ